jgi:2'-5' RNA ligase
MPTVKGYSLWLIPSRDVYKRLNNLISCLSRKYNTPRFEPHVTLLGEVLGSQNDIVLKTAQLASVIRSFRMELDEVKYVNEYFRCVFIKAQETDEVMTANQKARKIFVRETDPKYMPHLSLMYSDFSPQAKEKIITEIGKQIKIGFDVTCIHLFFTNGEVKDWYRVKEFSLA